MTNPSPSRPGSNIKLAGAKCPQCGKAALHAYRPFCSKRCSDLDLGAWLNGSYAIAGAEAVGDSNDDERS